MDKTLILMVEDEIDVIKVNERMLKRRGFEVLTAQTVKESLEILKTYTPDLVILDIMLPDGDGYEICGQFRQISDNPILFLSAKREISDRIKGLKYGADYYLTKPYHYDELLAVIERLVERKQKNNTESLVKKGEVTLDLVKHLAIVKDVDVKLTKKEFMLLLTLIENEDKELSHKLLYEKVWGETSNDDTRVIRTHISRLKVKLECDKSDTYDIISRYGKGYTFVSK